MSLLVLRHWNKMDCPECDGKMVLRNSKYGTFWGCENYPKCNATHGAHPDGTPLGIPADKETKKARMKAHDVFDKLWKRQGMKRTRAYRWLQERMGLGKEDCHIGRFDIEQCNRVVEICRKNQ